MTRMRKAQIGKCGELLVQLELLKKGVESAPMTTDAGIDLVAYSSRKRGALTIQVKANERPKPSGGSGRLALDWWVPVNSPAELVAFVDLSGSRIWLVTMKELARIAQQQSSGRYHFFMSVDPSYAPKKRDRRSRIEEFEEFRLDKRVESVF